MIATVFLSLLPLLALGSSSTGPHRFHSRQSSASKIQPIPQDGQGESNLCVTVMGGQAVVGAKINIATCFEHSDQEGNDKTYLQDFACSEDNTGGLLNIALQSAPHLCIDRGSDDSPEGSGLELQECINPPVPAQLWNYQNQQIISHIGDIDRCLDVQEDSGRYLKEGEPYASEKFLQTWTCVEGNTNQMWKLTPAQ
ncbi:uncharacterized protein I206_103887 [Kwoniella pini CBS 10737]|uniref:Ricin B lectin domain-containing protein n=1 Tax=Kwoniella pini CBS 10737 TaxID=1296096 RepID=A0A1B9I395_9TREE|nr:uncharacterized protein I206_04540 [Kwoniella pini CBS 10737]OCF50009.1 hypothetical protein I206_04540 [Kwoniella pini CBS 10737]